MVYDLASVLELGLGFGDTFKSKIFFDVISQCKDIM